MTVLTEMFEGNAVLYRADYINYTVTKRRFHSETKHYVKTTADDKRESPEREQKFSINHDYFTDAQNAIKAVRDRADSDAAKAISEAARMREVVKSVLKLSIKKLKFEPLPDNKYIY